MGKCIECKERTALYINENFCRECAEKFFEGEEHVYKRNAVKEQSDKTITQKRHENNTERA